MTTVTFGLATPPRRRKPSRAATLGIGVSIALHAGALAYLAIARFAPTLLPPDEIPEPPPIIVQTYPEPKPEPAKQPAPTETPPPSPAVKPREVVVPPLDFEVEAAPFPPVPDVPVDDGPPIMSDLPPLPDPAPAPVPAPPAPPAPLLITKPDWLQKPTGTQLADAYPPARSGWNDRVRRRSPVRSRPPAR